ncbi:hypothetical protein TrCOL_g10524 [Triparma columacea]|uniref:Amine oxidase domain-containing protein n=1 Tax=Triparma columacea TaxID=722753 RepID=A0A9W7LF22_9STRA|nr:hypothetical protein TrCOL_g10524 [Triparma columacea]
MCVQHQLQLLLFLAVLSLTKSYSVVVIGGGWAGYSASSTLASSSGADVEVTILEASPRNSGGGLAGGWRTASGRPVEAGIHGFWREYQNTFRVMRDEIGLDLDDVLSDFTPSVLFSKNGRVATAPVLATSARKGRKSSKSSNPILSSIYGSLPPPLDTALLADFDEKRLNLQDRISAVGLLSGWADFGQEDPDSWGRYDKISAAEFFLDYGGVTPNLYAELVSPMLHVLPMGPGSDISAAAALSCFHVFALQTRGAFDVRWAKGSLSDLIFDPWRVKLEEKGVRVEGGKRVNGIERAEDGDGMVVTAEDGSEYTADAVILAVGGTSAAKLKEGSKALKEAEGAKRVEDLRGVTCVATRIWLEPAPSPTTGLGGGAYSSTTLPKAVARAMGESPIAVVGAGVLLPELEETGFCIYDLQRMHAEQHMAEDTACLEVDMYRADGIADMSDDEIVELALRAVSSALKIDPLQVNVVDRAIVRARNAVSHFNIGSAAASPGIKWGRNVYACGDYIDRQGHASWSTEKAVVTGKQAAERVAKDLGLKGVKARVIPAAPDTPQLSNLRRLAKSIRRVSGAQRLPVPVPWTIGKWIRKGVRP